MAARAPASEEIAEKTARVRKLLAERDLDGVVVKRTANYAWLTGGGINYVGVAGETGVFAAVIARRDKHVVANNIEMTRIRDEEGLAEQGYAMLEYPWTEAGGEARMLASLTAVGRLGSDCGLPGTVDVGDDLARLRWSLTPREIDRYRELGRLTAGAIDEICLGARPGDSECAVAGRLSARLWDERIDYITLLAAADERIDRHRHPCVTDKKIGKRLMLSVNARRDGLVMSVTRFVQFGRTPADLRRKYADTLRIHAAMAAATRPGRCVADIFAEAVGMYAELGYAGEQDRHHQGGATGYVARDYKAAPGVRERVLANQAFAWNPTLTGAKSENVMLARDEGPCFLSAPTSFPSVTIKTDGHAFVFPDIAER